MRTDTIAAVATAAGSAGIGIIRISGENAIAVADCVYRSKNNQKKLADAVSHSIHYGFIYYQEELIDEVMVAVMKAPHTYTCEDIVEIDCHGGILVINKILEAVLQSGCRLAEAGEFTKRAFLNGRIDLSRAEAVMDIISSKNEFALKSSAHQLTGSLSQKVRSLREMLLYEIAFIESALDDPEHISLEGYSVKLEQKVLHVRADIQKLIDSADNGKILKEGINTVIVGKPNAGKSSLMNLLAGEEKAIVTSIAGTTRDILEEQIRLHGIGLNMIDTAGIRDTNDEVEKLGVEKAKKYAENADLILYMVDASCPLDENDDAIIKLISGKKVIDFVLNKNDLATVVSEWDIKEKFMETEQMTDMSENFDYTIIKTSTKENTGIDKFEQVIKDKFFHGEIAVNKEIYITNQRHKEALQEAFQSLELVIASIENQMPEDFYSIDLMDAYSALGRIIGEEVGDDLVNEIFGKFCMGK